MKNSLWGAVAPVVMVWILLCAGPASAATLPVSEDSYGFRAKLTLPANKAASVPVDASHRAFVFFDLRDLPAGATIRSAHLRVFFPRVVRAGNGLELHNVTGTWDESLASAEPAFAAAPLGTIPAASLRTKGFATVDVTAIAQSWLANPASNEGLAITAATDALPANVSSVSIGAKEGSGSGYPAELDVELDAAPVTGPLDLGASTLALGNDQNGVFTFLTDANGLRLTRQFNGSTASIFSANPNDGNVRVGAPGAGGFILRGDGTAQHDGSFAFEATTLTGNFTANTHTCVFFCNTANNSITVTLPSPSGANGRLYFIKKINANNTMSIVPSSGTIDGAVAINLTANFSYRIVMSNGSNWFVIGQ